MKTCHCCDSTYDADGWAALPCIGYQFTEDETGRYCMELRNCPCGSTIGIEVKLP